VALEQKAVVEQIDGVLSQCRRLIAAAQLNDYSDLPEDEVSEAVSLLFAAIARLSPPNSTYKRNAEPYEGAIRANLGRAVDPLTGILRAIRSDYAAGRLQSVVELVHADLFADFLEMAEHLLDQSFKDPAAVVVGSVLEEHLRKICQKNGIATVQSGTAPKKADGLNSELTAANVYSKLDHKSVTAWLDLRNKAAHGKYSEYTKEQVALMLQGVRDFISRNPA